MLDLLSIEQKLHGVDDVEALEKEIMDLALAATGANHGAIFLSDEKTKGLAIHFHVVEGLVVTLPGALLRRREDGRPNGVAFWVLDNNQPYLCEDAKSDPNYARYFLDVASIAAVPIGYQSRAIGVITVSSRRRGAFAEKQLKALQVLATASAKFLRRAQLYRATRDDSGRPFLIKGLSPKWTEVERRIEHVAGTSAPVLIHGESGTGKDLVARAVHFNSQRADRAFVTVNCAAIPETLLESVLFGHMKGAFTGASFEKIGEFQKAHEGTLFLDELGELPMPLQAKVLRAVEQGEIQPLGSNTAPGRVDVRLICATNRNLAEMVREGTFRDDLYYRLSVMTMELPALREYKADNLETMAHVFLQQGAQRYGIRTPRISTDAMALLQAYNYPGNVRELKNALEHAAIMCTDGEILIGDLPNSIAHGGSKSSGEELEGAAVADTHKTLKQLRDIWLAPLETRYLTDLLDECDGNVRRAAERAGINTVTMYRLLKKRGLKLQREVRFSSD